MSDLFTQQSTMPELFKTGEDRAEELKAQTVEPNTATDLLLNGDSSYCQEFLTKLDNLHKGVNR